MMTEAIIPTHPGQICRIRSPFEDEDPADVYVVTEDPQPFDMEDDIYVVNLKELQRNLSNPAIAPQIAVAKNELTVIADSIEKYIADWNSGLQ